MILASGSSLRASVTEPDTWADLPLTLRECGEIAGQRLSGVLTDALRQAEELLFSNSTQALTQGECEIMLNAAEFARVRREKVVEDFLKHFESRYVRACHYKPTILTGFQLDFDSSQLEVVPHDLLDDSLEPGMLSEAIQNAGWLSMNDLTQCFGILLAADSIKPNDMPLSPKLIEAAVSAAVRDQPWRHEAKSQVIRSLRRFFPDRVGLIYRDLVEHLHQVLDLALESDIPRPIQPQESSPDLVYAPVDGALCFEQENETETAASTLPPANEVIDYAMAAARGEALRRKVEPMIVLPSGQADWASTRASVETPVEAVVEAQPVKPTLLDPVVLTTPPEMPQPIAMNTPPIRKTRTSRTQAASMMAALACGARMEFRELDGSVTPLKLTWISPHKSLYLMTNREKKRTLSIGGDDLVAALCEGRVRIVMPSKSLADVGVYPRRPAKKTA